jgi:hypothetical protein
MPCGLSCYAKTMPAPPPLPPASSSADDEGIIEVLRRRKQILRRHVRSRMRSAYPLSSSSSSSSSSSDDNDDDDGILSSESDLVFGSLFSLPQYVAAGSAGIFLSMPRGEIRTDWAISRIASSSRGNAGEGKKKVLYVPRVGLDFKGRDMDMIRCDYGTAATTTGDGTGGGETSF